ncbi:hypothetical protein [Streptomyces sp. PTY087I2]|uniref:hypothetical protein n=1 Tax=Streptomyces sp. PTY087I2 TaxID=1819298 RepID=UPI00080B7A61|nr:hypothetical protein [Streptomyces sp. PTY087I2]OCC07660.1 hypothetical protein A3Q37_06549 [Streptomyces sp. PTY087I2]
MHIPAYAHAMIRAALPGMPTYRHVEGRDCCLCDESFGEDLAAIPLGPTPTSGLFGCCPCLTRLVTRARRTRDAALQRDAERARVESAAWLPLREAHLARLDGVREAAEAVTGLAQDESVKALQVAWLLISLESAYTWVPETPEPPASVGSGDPELKDTRFRLALGMVAAREAVAERLAYHLINEAQTEAPEMCEEFECPEGCTGRHDSSHIDCGPDAVYEDLAEHGIIVEQPEHEPLSPRLTDLPGENEAKAERPPFPGMEEQAPAVLKHFGVDADDADALLSAAAVGLVVDTWRKGPLDAIHAAADGPSDGEIFAQSVDLYRRARAALTAARENGPEALLAFVAVASDVDLPWAGGSSFALRTVSKPVAEFVQQVDDRVRFTARVMREQGWRAALLHRALSAAVKASAHFGMPRWPTTVASVAERLAELDRSNAPEALADLTSVETALLEAPDRLGVDALEWISRHTPLG